MHRRIILLTGTTATLLAGPLATGAMAQDASIGEVAAAVNSVWIVVAAILVMFMQAGFALVEAGFTRAKNAGNIIMKNVMDFSLGSLTYWAFGFALAYGGSSIGGFLAYGDLFFFDDQTRAGEWFFGGSILVGLIAGVIMVFSVMALEKVGIDDPVGAISVHGTAGLWGLIAVGLLTSDANVGIQLVGALAIAAWAFGTSFLVFKVIDLTVGMRVTPSEERAGLDRSEHGGEAYPEFVFQEQVASPRDLDPVGTNGH